MYFLRRGGGGGGGSGGGGGVCVERESGHGIIYREP